MQLEFHNITFAYQYNRPQRVEMFSILNFLKQIIDSSMNKYYSVSKDNFMKMLSRNESIFNVKAILTILRYESIPMVIWFMLLILSVALFIALLLLIFKTSGRHKVLNHRKNCFIFYLEMICFISAIVVIILSLAANLEFNLQIDEMAHDFPNFIIHVIEAFQSMIDVLIKSIQLILDDLMSVVNYVEQELINFPQKLTKNLSVALNDTISPEQIDANQIIHLIKQSFQEAGFIKLKSETKLILEESIYSFVILLTKSNDKILQLKENILKHNLLYDKNDMILDELLKVQEDLQRTILNEYQYNEWATFGVHMDYVVNTLLPKYNLSLYFLNELPEKLHVAVQNSSSSLLNATTLLKGWSKSFLVNTTHMVRLLISSDFINSTYKTVDSWKTLVGYIHPESKHYWIFIFPFAYGVITILLSIMAFLIGSRELKKHHSFNPWFVPPHRSIAIGLFRFSTFWIVCFLWILFAIGALFYFLSLFLSVVCHAINNEELLKNYLDKTIWSNHTWVSSHLIPRLPFYDDEIFVSDVLKECRKNKTFFDILYMEEHWNYEKEMKLNEIYINPHITRYNIFKEIDTLQLPDLSVIQTLIAEIKNMIFMLEFSKYETFYEKMQIINNAYMENKLSKIIGSLPRANIYDGLQKELGNIQRIIVEMKRNGTSFIYQQIKKLKNFKRILNETLIKVQLKQQQHEKLIFTIKNNTKLLLEKEIYNESNKIESLLSKYKDILKTHIKENVGKCYLLPIIYDDFEWYLCDYGLSLLNIGWISLILFSFGALLISMISMRFTFYIRGAKDRLEQWNKRYLHKKSTEQALLFNRIHLSNTGHICEPNSKINL